MAANADGRRRRQRSDAALNRARLLEAARRVLAEDPDASVSEIARVAGVGRGTAYRHFASREALVDAVARQARDDAEVNRADYLRPPGELAHVAPTPLSVIDVLDKVSPHQLGEQVIAEAHRLTGVAAAALYLVDLDGASIQRMAGADTFPERIEVPLAVGPEIPREGVEPLRARIEELLPGATVAPLYTRARAIGVLLAIGEADDALRDLAREAAAALALAADYTDAVAEVQRVRPTSAAAEIQQNLLPPRLIRVSGANVAGNVLPGYELGGDWFDYAENPEGTWLGLADAEGTGPASAGLASVLLGAFRASRRRGADPAEVVTQMNALLDEVTDEPATATATIALWNGPASVLRWVACGEIAPLLIDADDGLEVLDAGRPPRLGVEAWPETIEVQERRLAAGERMILLSDGILERPTADGGVLGIDGVHRAAVKAQHRSAAGTLRAIEDALRETVEDPLQDDATLIVLATTD
jgi:serine phosphatase RsbU (regulator of sigma subunit)